MSKEEALKLALEALKECRRDPRLKYEHPFYDKTITAIREALAEQPSQKRPQNCGTGYCSCIECVMEQPAQQQEPVAYDKTEINCFAQDLYDQKMREGKRGHYESMFHVIHQCIKKFAPPASKPWVGLTEDEIDFLELKYAPPIHPDFETDADHCFSLIRKVEAKLREKNNG